MIRSRDAVTTSAGFVRMDTQACGECAVAALQKAREYQEQIEGKNLTDEETKDAIDKLNDREYTGELYLPLPPSFYLSIYLSIYLYINQSISLSVDEINRLRVEMLYNPLVDFIVGEVDNKDDATEDNKKKESEKLLCRTFPF